MFMTLFLFLLLRHVHSIFHLRFMILMREGFCSEAGFIYPGMRAMQCIGIWAKKSMTKYNRDAEFFWDLSLLLVSAICSWVPRFITGFK